VESYKHPASSTSSTIGELISGSERRGKQLSIIAIFVKAAEMAAFSISTAAKSVGVAES
jgi:hypothetical protein